MSARFNSIRLLAIICLLCPLFASTALAQQVTIRGGKPEGNVRKFTWKITNNGLKSITKFKALHYGSNDAFAPNGWDLVEMTGNVRKTRLQPGYIIWEAASKSASILPGQTVEFQINITGAGQYEAPQSVTVTFSDGSTLDIPGVMCPTKEPFVRQNMAAIGLGVMAVLFVLFRTLWGRKKNNQQEAQQQD